MADIDVIREVLANMSDEQVAPAQDGPVRSNIRELDAQIVRDLVGRFRAGETDFVGIAQNTPFAGTRHTASTAQVRAVYAAWRSRVSEIAER